MSVANHFTLSNFFVILYAISFLIALTIIFIERKNPSAALAWLLILFMVPGIGILLYIFLSQNIYRQRIFRLTNYEHTILDSALQEQSSAIRRKEFSFSNEAAKKWQDMILLNQSYDDAFYTQNNMVTVFTNGSHKFESLLKDIREAKKSINIMYFIVKNDALGRALIHALTEKAKEGVEVRFLIDAMGSRQIRDSMLLQLRRAGGKFAYFFPPRIKFLKYVNLKLNYRNHRKIVVIDGQIGYIGGYNVGNEYLGKSKKFGNWRDTHLRLMGSAVQDINARFLLDWRFASGEDLLLPSVYYGEVCPMGSTGIQIVSSGPDSEKTQIKQSFLKMITSAKKNIYIQTPYFVPDVSLIEALRTAVYSGVDVRIMIPCMPDHMFVYWATLSYVGELLNDGARIFIYEDGFLHAKTLCVDGEVASVGSSNFDIRSFKLNFEANAFLYDESEVYKLESIFESDMASCKELTKSEYKKRSALIKFKESISRLLSDLL